MSFIGIISKKSDYCFIKKELVKKNNDIKKKIININKENIQNIKNVKFETLVICDNLKNIKIDNTYINYILNNSKYLLINTDNNINNIKIMNNTLQMITYGMNQKATVTASSIKEDEMFICLQRNIEDINGKVIEIQEFKRKSDRIDNNKIYNLLVIFVLEKLYN